MPGIYLHIPFCRRACTYCDFHFSTSTRSRAAVLDAMRIEMDTRAQEVSGAVGSIYFGGGTPSLLDPARIMDLMLQVRTLFLVNSDAEVTMEANPDDIDPDRLDAWKAAGITRISLGTQSFRDDRLAWMGRAHTAQQALRGINLIARSGFHSWTVDLIYGLPDMSLQEWDEQLTIALDHGMPHLSAYCLTVEARTALAHQVKKRLVTMPDDTAQAGQFDHLVARMEQAGLIPYEISNFGREGHIAVHNTNYWKGVPYIGIGPSAHSFDGSRRRWNVANNAVYLKAVPEGTPYFEEEMLTTAQRVNERLLTGLRTIWGVDLRTLGDDIRTRERATLDKYMDQGDILLADDRLVLTLKGRRFADRIASDLFLLDDDP